MRTRGLGLSRPCSGGRRGGRNMLRARGGREQRDKSSTTRRSAGGTRDGERHPYRAQHADHHQLDHRQPGAQEQDHARRRMATRPCRASQAHPPARAGQQAGDAGSKLASRSKAATSRRAAARVTIVAGRGRNRSPSTATSCTRRPRRRSSSAVVVRERSSGRRPGPQVVATMTGPAPDKIIAGMPARSGQGQGELPWSGRDGRRERRRAPHPTGTRADARRRRTGASTGTRGGCDLLGVEAGDVLPEVGIRGRCRAAAARRRRAPSGAPLPATGAGDRRPGRVHARCPCSGAEARLAEDGRRAGVRASVPLQVSGQGVGQVEVLQQRHHQVLLLHARQDAAHHLQAQLRLQLPARALDGLVQPGSGDSVEAAIGSCPGRARVLVVDPTVSSSWVSPLRQDKRST